MRSSRSSRAGYILLYVGLATLLAYGALSTVSSAVPVSKSKKVDATHTISTIEKVGISAYSYFETRTVDTTRSIMED